VLPIGVIAPKPVTTTRFFTKFVMILVRIGAC
jgi:hypothetical protein